MNNPNAMNPPNQSWSGLGRAFLGGAGTAGFGVWQPPTVEALQRELPQYQILRLLGRGGMGAVYEGLQTSLGRTVAIKILSQDLQSVYSSLAERFRNEARALAKLTHSGIVTVHDFGETTAGQLFIVMEFVNGTDVEKMIGAEGRLSIETSMFVISQVCDALAYAHEQGIIHRDIKPANIMMTPQGGVKVADFGLAEICPGYASTSTRLYHGSDLKKAAGTEFYRAPETMEETSKVDHRADIYALGVMLYHMLTGRVPLPNFTPASHRVHGLDAKYDDVIAKALMERPDERYQTVAEIRTALDVIVKNPALETEPAAAVSGLKFSWRWFGIFLLAVGFSCLGLLAVTFKDSRSSPGSNTGDDSEWFSLFDGKDLTEGKLHSADSQEEVLHVKSVPPEPNDFDWPVGSWYQTNDGNDYPIYLLDLRADKTATFTSGKYNASSWWTLDQDAVIISWPNGARYRIEKPSKLPSTLLQGVILDADGRIGMKNQILLRKKQKDSSSSTFRSVE